MAFSKYADDYRLENVMDRKGRLVTKPVYRGDLFDYRVQGEGLKKLKVTFLVSTVLEAIVFFISLFINARCLHALYVVMPYLGAGLPLLGQADAVWSLWSAKTPVERIMKDKVSQKLVAYTFAVAFLSFCSVCGHLVFWVTRGETAVDMVFFALSAVFCALSANLFLSRKSLEMEKVGSTKSEEAE